MQVFNFKWSNGRKDRRTNELIYFTDIFYNYSKKGALNDFRKKHKNELNSIVKISYSKVRF